MVFFGFFWFFLVLVGRLQQLLSLWLELGRKALNLYPLFNKDCELVGWIEPDEHIFDTSMQWVAYVRNDHAWSTDSGNWLGAV